MAGMFDHARWLPLALSAFILTGCATAAQRQYQGMVINAQSAGTNIQACVQPVYESPDAAPIRPHIPMNVKDATLQQLSDKSFANDAEINAILVTHPKLNDCRQQFLTQLSQTTPSISAIWASFFAENEQHLIKLIQKQTSWGEYLSGAKLRAADVQLRLTQESQRITAGLERSHEAELARRQAAASAFAQYMQTQEIINNMNRPVVTNCNAFGNTVNCVSH